MTVEELQAAGVRAAALVLVDNAGITRMKCVPIERLGRAAERGVGWASVWGLVLADDTFAQDPELYSPSGELRLHADLRAAALLPCSPGWAWAPIDHREQTGEPWQGCQRDFVRRMVESAAERGLEIKFAWELEWVVGEQTDGGFVALHQGPGYGAVTFGRTGPLILELIDSLRGAGVSLEQIHPEYADGQMELSLSPQDPLRACDESVLTRHLIHTIGRQAGWRVSFSPRTVAGLIGNGAHLHVSVWRDGVNQLSGGDGPAGMQQEGAAFLAGVLEHLQGMTAVGAPSAVSYFRLQPSHWAGAHQCWGNENREAALRLQSVGGASANFEWKAVDCSANPYLAAGSLIAAGIDGVARKLVPPEPITADPEELPAGERPPRLPATLEAAANALEASRVLRDAMGGYLHDRVVAVRRAEAERSEGLDEDELVIRHRWRY
jgi:glutamine synthetase